MMRFALKVLKVTNPWSAFPGFPWRSWVGWMSRLHHDLCQISWTAPWDPEPLPLSGSTVDSPFNKSLIEDIILTQRLDNFLRNQTKLSDRGARLRFCLWPSWHIWHSWGLWAALSGAWRSDAVFTDTDLADPHLMYLSQMA